MLTKLSNKEVRGPTFTVFVPDIHRVQYSEGDKVLNVEIEGGSTSSEQVDWTVYSQMLTRWDPPHQMEEISAQKREEILSRISQALDLLEMPHEIA